MAVANGAADSAEGGALKAFTDGFRRIFAEAGEGESRVALCRGNSP